MHLKTLTLAFIQMRAILLVTFFLILFLYFQVYTAKTRPDRVADVCVWRDGELGPGDVPRERAPLPPERLNTGEQVPSGVGRRP